MWKAMPGNGQKQGMKHNIPDRVMKDIRFLAGKHNIQKIILFGSRARGTHSERSDIDLAVTGGDVSEFYWDIHEKVWSLLSFDIVELDKGTTAELQEEIDRDGIVIYEKNR